MSNLRPLAHGRSLSPARAAARRIVAGLKAWEIKVRRFQVRAMLRRQALPTIRTHRFVMPRGIRRAESGLVYDELARSGRRADCRLQGRGADERGLSTSKLSRKRSYGAASSAKRLFPLIAARSTCRIIFASCRNRTSAGKVCYGAARVRITRKLKACFRGIELYSKRAAGSRPLL
jgi:hypothetical protein